MIVNSVLKLNNKVYYIYNKINFNNTNIYKWVQPKPHLFLLAPSSKFF